MSTSVSPTSATASSLVERLGLTLSTSVNAQTIYGAPVEYDGVTVISVARVQYGFGGGGASKAVESEVAGAGAGVNLVPVGYIELKQGAMRFRPIRSSIVPLVAVSGLVALLLLRSITPLLRRR
ncbi:GerW family sporulation protein [Hymenobacter volaticus]|uniref:Sporulation protein n=1 Tax=Hymenobacter volaticus TaxID=2932254 RepID=A0ABY4GFC9_9BACT|nr:spore germination protein GerW family protein [Hymenobacter volaticus]UOQ69658.1 hypothetical protein MUN86_28950 [Hymenobacter volaticus]